MDGEFSKLDSLTVHWLAAAAEGTCASSDCRQLTVSLTSVFSKQNVISEAEENGGDLSFIPPQITAVIPFAWPSLWISPQSSVSSLRHYCRPLSENCTHLVSLKLLLFTSSVLGLP